MARTGIVLQARLGSSRLPGKVLAPIGGRTVLEHCLTRLAQRGFPIVVATTERSEDDAIEIAARRLGALVCRGSEHDVLDRYIQAARQCELTEIVRATADNPIVDAGATGPTVGFRQRVGADHALESGLPGGAAV